MKLPDGRAWQAPDERKNRFDFRQLISRIDLEVSVGDNRHFAF
jgi:hypothetical protein